MPQPVSTKTAGFADAARAHTSLLARVEKKALIAMARRTPAFVTSDHLTVLGLLAMLGAGLSYWAARANAAYLWLVSLCLVLNWFGDSMDGTVARVRNQQRPRYGFYVDHVVDALGTLFLLGGLALSGYMSAPVAIGLLVVYFLLSIETYLATYALGTFHLSHWGFGPTELRLLLIAGNTALLVRGGDAALFGKKLLLFDAGGVVGIAGMCAMFVAAAVRHTAELYRSERLP